MRKILFSASFLLILFTLHKCSIDMKEDCDEWTRGHIFETSERNYMNFSFKVVKFASFDELNISSCSSGIVNDYSINLFPLAEMLVFNVQRLQIQNLIEMFNLTSERKHIIFHKIKGFDQDFFLSKLNINLSNLETYSINFYDSKLEFFLNGSNAEILCSLSNLFDLSQINYFGSIKTLVFNKNILYISKICPYVFMNSMLEYLCFNEVSNSLLFRNRLEFLNINTTNALIEYLNKIEFTFAFEILTEKILNRNLFKNVKIIKLNGLLNGIESNLLGSFQFLNRVSLNIENLKNFIQSGTDWINVLNADKNLNLSYLEKNKINPLRFALILEINILTTIFSKPYIFPNEDICLFKSFPHHKLVYPFISFQEKLTECSCTLMWLIKYANFYAAQNLNTEKQCLLKNDITCDFETLFKACVLYQASMSISLIGDLNMTYFFKWIEYVIGVYFKSFFCLLSIVANVLVILIVKNRNERKLFNSSMYKHILANSLFNLAYCFLSSFSLINICIFPTNSFCSHLFQSDAAQYLEIYVFNFLGNAIRFCSNFSYFIFSFHRYMLSTSSSSNDRYLKMMERVNVRLVYCLVFLFGILLSLFKIFEFKKNDPFNIFDVRFPFNAYDIDYCTDDTLSLPKSFLDKCELYKTLNMINNVVNNVLFLFFSFLVDILLIIFARNYVKQKKDLTPEQPEHEHVREAIKLKEKIKKLVIANNILFLFSHFPEFITTILLIIYSKKLSSFCFDYFSCTDLIEISQSFNLLSFSFQIFIFLDFDRNFRQSLADLKQRLINWIILKMNRQHNEDSIELRSS